MCSCDFFLGVLALLFPPLAVWVKRGICSADSIINILLCMLGYLPGLFHAWYIIVKYPEPDFAYDVLAQDAEGVGASRVTYVVVHPSNGRQQQHQSQTTVAPKIQSNMNYGTGGAAPAAPETPAQDAAPSAASSSSAPAQQPCDDAGEGGSHGPPPSYAQAVASDNKIQNHD